MKKIYLFCSGGMSTSLLAQKMQNYANENKLLIEVGAYSQSRLEDIVQGKHPDCILLGPQVRHLYQQTQILFGTHIPVGVIEMKDFGQMNGEAVLKKAMILMNDFKETALH